MKLFIKILLKLLKYLKLLKLLLKFYLGSVTEMLTCVRHGESTANQNLREDNIFHGANAALTLIGQQQAQTTAIALTLELTSPVMIWTSELDRTNDTARPLVTQLQSRGKKVIIQQHRELNEKRNKLRESVCPRPYLILLIVFDQLRDNCWKSGLIS